MTANRFAIHRIGGPVIVEGLLNGGSTEIEYAHPSVRSEELDYLVPMIADDVAQGLSLGRLTRDLEWFGPTSQQTPVIAEAATPGAARRAVSA
jgi:hypothetical protein